MLDSSQGVWAGQARSEYPATFVLFSKCAQPVCGSMHPPVVSTSRSRSTTWPAFPLVSALMVGATEFEPVTSSVSANSGEALCDPPFSYHHGKQMV